MGPFSPIAGQVAKHRRKATLEQGVLLRGFDSEDGGRSKFAIVRNNNIRGLAGGAKKFGGWQAAWSALLIENMQHRAIMRIGSDQFAPACDLAR